MTDIQNKAAGKTIVFYDGGCPLCRREIAHYRRLSAVGAVQWVDVSEDAGLIEAFGVDRAGALRRFHVLDRDGVLRDGVCAFLALWRALPYYRVLARLVQASGCVSLLEAVYCRFADWRYQRLYGGSKCDACVG